MSRRAGITMLAAAVVALALGGGSSGLAAPTLPGNGRIVFATDDGMASINPDGSGAWGLRFTRIGQIAPAWSPDGSVIAFSQADGAGVYAMDPDGTRVRPVAQIAGAGDPSWSPDGEQIAFDAGGRLYLVGAGGGAVTELVEGTSPAWSPDGASIAFARNGDIEVLDFSSGATTPVAQGPAYDTLPAWSPVADTILFVSDRGGQQALYTARPDGSALRRVTDGPYSDSEPAWSPDGSQIAFSRIGELWVARGDGSGAHRLVFGNAWSRDPSWQPLPAGDGDCSLVGTEANDLLVGSNGTDIVCGLGGNDTLLGMGGSDVLRAGDGQDWVAGGLGGDTMLGEEGSDRIDARDDSVDIVDGGGAYDIVVSERPYRDSVTRAERRTFSANVSAWRHTTASNEEATNPSVMAVDGRFDDYWSSGGYPPQWIEVDLGRPATITRLRLITPDLLPQAVVLVLGRKAEPGPYRLLHRLDGPTAFRQAVNVRPRRPWKNVRFVQLRAPAGSPVGWVAWPEIEVFSTTP